MVPGLKGPHRALRRCRKAGFLMGGANLSHGDLQKSTVKILESISIIIYIYIYIFYHRGIILTPTSGFCLDCGWGSRCQAVGSGCPISIAPLAAPSGAECLRRDQSCPDATSPEGNAESPDESPAEEMEFPWVPHRRNSWKRLFLTHPAIFHSGQSLEWIYIYHIVII